MPHQDLFNPPNDQPYDKLWAVLSVDTEGNEGIVMVRGPFGPTLAVTGSEFVLHHWVAITKTPEAQKEIEGSGKKLVIGTFGRIGTEPV